MAKKEIKETGFALTKENYKLMAIGFAIIVVGFKIGRASCRERV